MKHGQSLVEIIGRGKVLLREKETETNWSKMDQVLEEVAGKLEKREDAQQAQVLVPLVCRAIQSNRSKLSGTGCKVAQKLFGLLEDEMREHVGKFLPPMVGALGKANKVISGRALSLAQTIGDTCNIRGLGKQLRGHAQSASRSVKQGVLELSIRGMKRDGEEEFAEIIELLLNDAAAEIRARAREGMSQVEKLDRGRFCEIVSKLPEKVQQLISPKKEKEARGRGAGREEDGRPVPSVIVPINASPRRGVIKVKESGNNIVVRGPMRAYLTDTAQNVEMRKALRPGYSLERLGQRLAEHNKGIEEALRKERTPRKTPVKSKRPREGTETPSCLLKREKEDAGGYNENTLGNISEEILNLSLIQTEGTEQIVETKEVDDNIFIGEEIKGSKGFLESCELAADPPEAAADEAAEYTMLGPEVQVNRATVEKL